MKPLKTISPTTGKALQSYDVLTNEEIDNAIHTAHQAFLKWRELTFKERAQILEQTREVLLDNIKEYGALISNEMGKPITAAMSEIEKCAAVCKYYAENSERFLADRIIKSNYQKSVVCYRPSGVIFAIMPWNFPFWQVFRFAAPNLMAGHACLVKHAESVTGCGLAMQNCFEQAGLPMGLFKTLTIHSAQAEYVIQHECVKGVTLTGSERAGKIVSAQASTHLKKSVLELGGSDPYVMLEDANIQQAADACVISRLNNSGQVCIAAKRLIVCEKIYDAFKKAVLDKIKDYKMGNPFNEATQLGPLAREDLRMTVHNQVQQAIEQGAKLLKGGVIPDGDGFYYPITVLENVKPGNIAFDDEIFGPVICFIKAKNETQAITLANQSRFGLGGAVFTKDIKRGEEMARNRIHAGTVTVNTYVQSHPALPFGGIKASGFGRELSLEGLIEFMNIKTVVVK